MPSLVLCDRRTFVAGDDLRLSIVLNLLLRGLQFAVLVPLTAAIAQGEDLQVQCEGTTSYRVRNARSINIGYLVTSFLLVAIATFLEVRMWRTSGKGTPTQPEKRSQLKGLCYLNLIPNSLLRVTAITLGIISSIALHDYCECEEFWATAGYVSNQCRQKKQWITLVKILLGTHFVDAAYVALVALYFFCKCAPSPPPLLSAEARWSLLCHCFMGISSCLTCCIFGGRQVEDFADISMTLADFFDSSGTVDVVPSDIIVGLRMLLQEQEQRQLECRNELIEHAKELKEDTQRQRDAEVDEEMGEEVTLEGSKEEDSVSDDRIDPQLARLAFQTCSPTRTTRMNPLRQAITYQIHRSQDNLHFRPMARPILLPTNALDKLAIAEGTRFIRLARAMYTHRMYLIDRPCNAACVLALSHIRSYWATREYIVNDTRGYNFVSLLAEAELESSQIIYANFSEGVIPTPYAITIDYEWRSVVISIRGTQALEDLVTDMTLRPASMGEWGSCCGLKSEECYAHAGMLATTEWIFNDLERHGLLDKFVLEERSPIAGYRVRVVGHSLGAGCASLLGFMLKSKYPDLRCHCFSPPGCTMSEEMAESCKDYVTSYLLDADIVPRLSLESMDHLRDAIYEMIARIKVSKYKAMNAKQKSFDKADDRILHRRESIEPSKFTEQLAEYRARRAAKKSEREMDKHLYPPGRIVQLVKTGEEGNCLSSCSNTTPEELDSPYTARWIEASDLGEVILSSHLLLDHRPLYSLNELERTANAFGLSPPFVVSEDPA